MQLKKPKSKGVVEVCARDTMYPSFGFMIKNHAVKYGTAQGVGYSNLYGYAFAKTTIKADGVTFTLRAGEYIGLPVKEKIDIQSDGQFFGVFRLGYQGQQILGKVEPKGRLSYIDGCSDTLLVYPPRLGDPTFNFLYFPPGINQTFHTHPSIRIGCVSEGKGYSCLGSPGSEREIKLSVGDLFMLEEHEMHRFRTEKEAMKVVPFHPDGDWGPTDHNHTMLNRTYLAK